MISSADDLSGTKRGETISWHQLPVIIYTALEDAKTQMACKYNGIVPIIMKNTK